MDVPDPYQTESPFLRGGASVLTVAQAARAIRELLEGSFPAMSVRGEVSNLSRPQSGHIYFSLIEDENDTASRLSSAQLPCVVWRSTAARLPSPPENGRKVVVRGRIGVYEPRGTYQLIADRVEPVGVGELQLRFEELKERLRREGLFDPARKRGLPFLPKCVGLVTSPAGAAVQDVLRALIRRHPGVCVRIAPARVQGEGSVEDLVRALAVLNSSGAQVDVIVLARGGGGLEDLWAFNDERLARALAASRVPTVSAVGHEVDFSIADFVADARAQTPTQAAELVVPDVAGLHDDLSVSGTRLARAVRRRLEVARGEFGRLASGRLYRDPQAVVQKLFERCDDVAESLKFHLYNRSRQWDDALSSISGRLEALNPLKVLARGYSVTTDSEGRVVQDAVVLGKGDKVRILLARGSAEAEILGINPHGGSPQPVAC
jgi:exodeoxyribonuclease VII large subunit